LDNEENESNHIIKYEILKRKTIIEINENLYELIVSNEELLLLVCKLLDNLLYVSFLLYINANMFSSKDKLNNSRSICSSKK
jgi:hypothetical protein